MKINKEILVRWINELSKSGSNTKDKVRNEMLLIIAGDELSNRKIFGGGINDRNQ